MQGSNDQKIHCAISTVVFDYGGVLAEEGFRDGLLAIARMSEIDGPDFFQLATDAIYETGYLTGRQTEEHYWESLRKISGVELSDETMRDQIISRFRLRPPMMALVKLLRRKGLKVRILSDQTNWLDELNIRDQFFGEFDSVINSYHFGKGKRDVTIFQDLVSIVEEAPCSVLFIDDNEGHTLRARSVGIQAITFSSVQELAESLHSMSLITDSELRSIISE